MNFGGFSQIVPVQMRPNLPPQKSVVEAAPEVGIHWGKQSTFRFSASNPEHDSNSQTPPLPFVRNSTKHVFETRVETIQTPNWKQFRIFHPQHEGYLTRSGGQVEHSNEEVEVDGELTDYQIDLGEEAQQEIAGFTSYADGRVEERYKTVLVHRYLSVGINKTPGAPNPGSLGHTEGGEL